MSEETEDRRFLSALADAGRLVEGDELAAMIDDRRVDTIRARRWLANATRRGLVARDMDRDSLGRPIGQFRFGLAPDGAKRLNELSDEEP